MRKVFGIGETILDIIFRNDQPQKAVPGGSVFNGLISLGRLNTKTLLQYYHALDQSYYTD